LKIKLALSILICLLIVLSKTYGQNVFPTPEGNAIIYQSNTGYRSYDVINKNDQTVTRLEATTDGSCQLWLKDEDGTYKILLKTNSLPSSISGELIIGEYTTTTYGKKFFVKGNAGVEGNLTVDGNLMTEEVKVEILDGADFVFDQKYNLMPLEEVKAFISHNQHLPEIPSAQEMQDSGLDLGEMNIKLLQKIEELTLYQIQLLEKQNELAESNLQMQLEIKQLKGVINKSTEY